MSAQSSKTTIADNVADISKLPKFIEEQRQVALPKGNVHTPKLRSPTESQIAKAIVDVEPQYKRALVAKAMHPELAKMVRAAGEPDPSGDPHIQYVLTLACYLLINYDRKVMGNGKDILTKSEGSEASNYEHFKHAAEVELEK